MKKINEKAIETAILKYAQTVLSKELLLMKINTTGIYDPIKKIFRTPSKYVLKGTPDIIGCAKDGRMVAVEVKTPDAIKSIYKHRAAILERKQYPKSFSETIVAQVKLIHELKKMGAVAFFAASVDEFICELIVERVIRDSGALPFAS